MTEQHSTPNGQSPFVQAYFAVVDRYAEVTGQDADSAERELEQRAELLARASHRDVVPGQVTVVLDDGREFAVIKGRRWTRVPEYMSNGQLTARWFVDEATSEVRLADSWRKPKAWPLGQPHCLFVLDIVAKARQS